MRSLMYDSDMIISLPNSKTLTFYFENMFTIISGNERCSKVENRTDKFAFRNDRYGNYKFSVQGQGACKVGAGISIVLYI